MKWDTVIGLEVHVQLKTASKLFSSAPTAYGAPANTQTSYIDAALPGVLPVLNRRAVDMAIQFGLSINAKIHQDSYFERKNYIYPDLPKGYQISQLQKPMVTNGHLVIALSNGQQKTIIIERAHLEEDAGKSIHDAKPYSTGIDLNRAGTPLLEIVTTPCLHSAEEVITYLKTLNQLVRFLGISDGNMQEGSFRCDVNFSLKPEGSSTLGTRTELKNLNSFRFIEQAIDYEQQRHLCLLTSGQPIHQETRLYSPTTGKTYVMRSKENENDYRYFPDPDLLPIHITTHHLETLRQTLPELPSTIRKTLQQHQFPEEDLDFLLSTPEISHYFKAVCESTSVSAKKVVNWLKGPLMAVWHEQQGIENTQIEPQQLGQFLTLLEKKSIAANQAKSLFSAWAREAKPFEAVLQAIEALPAISNQAISEVIEQVLHAHPQQVADYQQGKEKLLAFFVGQVLKEMKGQVSAPEVNQLLRERLHES